MLKSGELGVKTAGLAIADCVPKTAGVEIGQIGASLVLVLVVFLLLTFLIKGKTSKVPCW